MTHEFAGVCPVCAFETTFVSKTDWFRDALRCKLCNSIPRERAFAWCLNLFVPNWRALVMHECSPSDRSISAKMRKECAGYIGTQYYADVPAGEMKDGYRSENLEALSFGDESLDMHCHLDVLEHVNEPAKCFAEMERTLRPGGIALFTTPIFEGKLKTERRARFTESGVEHLAEPEYHGNPIDESGALVTFHYGSDFADLMVEWAPGCGVTIVTPNDPAIGVLGKFREVVLLKKRGGPALAAGPEMTGVKAGILTRISAAIRKL